MLDLMEIEEQLDRQAYLLEKGKMLLEDQLLEIPESRQRSTAAGDYFYSHLQLERSQAYLEAVQDYLIEAVKQLAETKALLNQKEQKNAEKIRKLLQDQEGEA